jgi:hypothetical protein
MDQMFGPAVSDMLYVPEQLASRFLLLASHFRQHKVFVEVAIPETLVAISNGSENIEPFPVSFTIKCRFRRNKILEEGSYLSHMLL